MALETRGMTSNLEIEGTRRAEFSQKAGGLEVDRKLTAPGEDPLEQVEYVLRDSQITNADGSVVFELKGAQVPEGWSQLATDIAALRSDPRTVERLAREELGLAAPGETVFLIHQPARPDSY